MGSSLLGRQLTEAQKVLAKVDAGVSLDQEDLSALEKFRSGVETLLNPDPTRKQAAHRASDVLHETIMAAPYLHFSLMDQGALDRVLTVQGRSIYCVLKSAHGSEHRFDSVRGHEDLLPGPTRWITLEKAHKRAIGWESYADTVGGTAAIVSMPAVFNLFRANPKLVFDMPFVSPDTLSMCQRFSPEMINSGAYMTHQGTIGVPARPELLRNLFRPDQLRAMASYIGDAELRRLSLDSDHTPENEGRNLLTVREAVYAVIGRGAEAPWIIGFASEFANGLLHVA